MTDLPSGNRPAARRTSRALALGVLLAAAIAGCSSSSGSSKPTGSFSAAPSEVHPTAPSAPPVPAGGSPVTTGQSGSSAGAVAKITVNWDKFFNPATSGSERVKLLQNGSDFSAAVTSFSSSPLASAVSSKVDLAKLTSATQANVTYDLTAGGTAVASGASGTSVLQNGIWKVGDDVFCSLLSKAKSLGLSVTVPAACK